MKQTGPATAPARPTGVSSAAYERIFAGVFGAFLGLALLKFNNPPIMEKWVEQPNGFFEFLLGNPWPIAWAYWLLVIVAGVGLFAARRPKGGPTWFLFIPLAWYGWQILAAISSVDHELSHATLKHFTAILICFYLGLLGLAPVRSRGWFWTPLVVAFCLVLTSGWSQQFGGLEETRRYFYLYIYPQAKQVAPEYLKRLESTRIFGTLFYPNALAGALLLLLPPILVLIAQLRERFTRPARGFLVAVVGLAGLACLFWSKSKGGWLLMLLIGLVALLRLPLGKRFKQGLVLLVLVAGLAGFFLKYAGFFRQGATSVVARFDYWNAAVRTLAKNPVFGSGPGTFAIPYGQIKRPEAEPARLVHNDYLEQGSDSGAPGLALYTLMIACGLWMAYPKTQPASGLVSARPAKAGTPNPHGVPASGGWTPALQTDKDWLPFAVWLGLLGWSLQGFVEFGLYIPALAWPAMALFGWLIGGNGRRSRPGSQSQKPS